MDGDIYAKFYLMLIYFITYKNRNKIYQLLKYNSEEIILIIYNFSILRNFI